MLSCRTLIAIIGLVLPALTAMAQGAADAQKGQQVLNECRACHSLEAGKNGIGPSLRGLFGRKDGTVPGYTYSTAMKDSNIVWNADALEKYLANPQEFIPGNKMAFPGIKGETQLDHSIVYPKQVAN